MKSFFDPLNPQPHATKNNYELIKSTYKKVEHAESKEIKCQTNVAMVVKPV